MVVWWWFGGGLVGVWWGFGGGCGEMMEVIVGKQCGLVKGC